MEYCVIGGELPGASRIGFGAAPLGGYDYGPVDDDVSIRAVHAALDAGITFFDTADVYGLGRSERVLGRALGGCRDRVLVATKGGVAFTTDGRTRRTLAPAHLAAAIDASLERLRTDYIDLYQLHWPDDVTPLADAIGTVQRAVEAGKVRAIGVCNFSLPLLEAAQACGRIASQQVPRSLLEAEWAEPLASAAARWQIAGICYNALAQGLLSGKYDSNSQFSGSDLRRRSALFSPERLAVGLRIVDRLRTVATRHGVGTAQVALRWLLDQPGVSIVLTGIKTDVQARQNAAAVNFDLEVDERGLLSEVACKE